MQLETERLMIRAFVTNDWENLHALYKKPETN
jgi:hypothetical protein